MYIGDLENVKNDFWVIKRKFDGYVRDGVDSTKIWWL